MQLHDVIPDAPTTTEAASALFDSLDAVDPDFMFGTWHGAEMPTGHPIDGALAASGWWGKQFIDSENVHPLLFPEPGRQEPVADESGDGVQRARRPACCSATAEYVVLPADRCHQLRHPGRGSRRGCAPRYRGVDSATMVYDQLPINDVFHRISDDAVLGAMDLKVLRGRASSSCAATTRSRCAETGISSERASSPGNRDRTHTQTY